MFEKARKINILIKINSVSLRIKNEENEILKF